MRRRHSAFVAFIVLVGVCFLRLGAGLLGSRKELILPESTESRSGVGLPTGNSSSLLLANGLAKGPEAFYPETTNLCDPPESDLDFRRKSGLFCVVAGIEHSGTTMTSSLLMNAPNLYGAFELGLLLASKPRQFATSKHVPKLLVDGITKPTSNHWWGLTNDQRDELLRAKCVAEQYNLLRRHSPIYKALNTSWIVDKTPAYYNQLYSIMKRTPGVPFVVTQKDDDAIRSSFRKRNESTRTIETKLRVFHSELHKAQRHFSDRLFVMNYTAFTERPDEIMTQVFSFLGLQWDSSYLTNNEFNQKGSLIGRPPSPGFNATRSECQNCVTDPYGH